MGRCSKSFDFFCKLDGYPAKKPPKSTGREHYGEQFVLDILRRAIRWRITEPDVICTMTYYTAWTVRKACEDFLGGDVSMLVAAGGGVHNSVLMRQLTDLFAPARVVSGAELGIDPDFKEALCFAVLASELIDSRPAGMPNVTGASQAVLLGKICPA